MYLEVINDGLKVLVSNGVKCVKITLISERLIGKKIKMRVI